MANGLNKVLIIGNLGGDPELRYTQRGTAVCNFSVAVNRPGRVDEGGERQEDDVEWFKVVAWDKLAESCGQYLAKGRQVYVEGSLHTSSWEADDGQRRYKTEVVARSVLFLSRPPQAEQDGGDWPDDMPYR